MILASLGILAIIGALLWAFVPGETGDPLTGDPETARAYLGAKACAECHPGEFAHYSRSGHARTLRPATETQRSRWLDGHKAKDPEHPGVVWSYSLERGRLVARRSTAGDQEIGRQFLDYAFGSGSHGMTFLSLTDKDPHHPSSREHRLSYITGLDEMLVTVGHRQPNPEPDTNEWGRDMGPESTLRCFHCHTTLTSSRGNTVLDPETLVPNVSCERCHGPGRAHAEAARRGESDLSMTLGPRHGWTAEEQLRACGECHRLPEMVQSGAIQPDNLSLVRFQPIGILGSACYRKSSGELSCVTCHDPHARPSTDPLHYEAACLRCHQETSKARVALTICPVSPRGGCLPCHMPRRQLVDGIRFTDHWIVRRPK